MGTTERLWYSQVVEAIFVKGLGPKLTPEVRARVKAHGIDLDKLLPGYPVEQVLKAARDVLPQVLPGLSDEAAWLELGASSMRGYNETLLGRAAVGVLKLIGVRRALERLHTSMRSGNNFLETRFTPLSATSAELHLSDVSGVPGFYQGLLEEGGRLVGAKNLTVRSAVAVGQGHTFVVEWEG